MTTETRAATTQADETPVMGALFHTELRSSDPIATMRFLEATFGWSSSSSPSPVHFVLDLPGHHEGHLGPPYEGDPPSAIPYILVDDLGAIERSIVDHGGTIVEAVREVPHGRYLAFRPPGGPALMAWQMPDAEAG